MRKSRIKEIFYCKYDEAYETIRGQKILFYNNPELFLNSLSLCLPPRLRIYLLLLEWYGYISKRFR